MPIRKRFKSIIGPVDVGENQLVPRHLGKAYRDYMRNTTVYYLFGLHWVIQVVYWLESLWSRLRFRESWIDRQVMARHDLFEKYREQYPASMRGDQDE